jgi:glycerate kinase
VADPGREPAPTREPEPASWPAPGRGPLVVVSPDSFKGTFTAGEVAAELASGLRSGGIERIRTLPVADGGEGTLEALLGRLDGELRAATVRDPLGRAIEAIFGISRDRRTAVVEIARAVGLGLVGERERDAEAASTEGVGELIVAARDAGAGKIVVGLGGSATTDGGAGAIAAIVASGGLRGSRLVVLCDVMTPFEQAARVFGPQKGADRDAVVRLTDRLEGFARRLPRDPRGVAMTGAAGGLAGGLWAAFDGRLVGGAGFVLDWLGFDRLLVEASAVVTGEGCLDRQTVAGKVVAEIAGRGRRAGVPVHAVVGRDDLGRAGSTELGLSSVREGGTGAGLRAAGAALAGQLLAR